MQPPTPPERSEAFDASRIQALLAPVAVAHGVEICAVEWASSTVGRVLRVVIDRPGPSEEEAAVLPAVASDHPGVSLEDCARVSRDASVVLDVAEAVDGRYHLEVSSPGIDRPLVTARDFRRNLGRLLKVKLRAPAADGQCVLRGPLLAVNEGQLRMQVDGNDHVVSLEDVEQARIVIDFGRPPKVAGGKRTKATLRRTSKEAGRGAEVRRSHPARPRERSGSTTERRPNGRS